MPRTGKYDHLKTLEDIQNFIDCNNIQSFKEIHDKYPALKARLYKLGYRSNDLKLAIAPQKDWSKYNTLEDFQNFIAEHNIKNRTQLERGEYSGLFIRAIKLGLANDLKYIEAPRKDWSFIKDINDVQKFIEEHHIQNAKELYAMFPGIYNKMNTLHLDKSQLRFPNPLRQDISMLNCIQDFQNYIYVHNIKSLQEFKQYHSGVLSRLYNLKLSTSQLKFELSNQSRSELLVMNFLDLTQVQYVKQKQFDDLPKLRFDFYLPEQKIAIECQGEQHIMTIDYWGGEERFKNRLLNDSLKVEYCKNHNIKLFKFYLFNKKCTYKLLGSLSEYEFIDFNVFMYNLLKFVIK